MSRIGSRPPQSAGFTLVEVMVALVIVAIALVALLGLQHQSLQSIIRESDSSKAALLGQAIMTRAELEQFPQLGNTNGNFEDLFPDQYPNFKWQRSVQPSAVFPDIRMVQVSILYGPRFSHHFDLVELLHSPIPIQVQTQGSQAAPQ